MKVYVLLEDCGYDGYYFIATFATQELAEQQAKILNDNRGEGDSPDDFEIKESEVLDQVNIKGKIEDYL